MIRIILIMVMLLGSMVWAAIMLWLYIYALMGKESRPWKRLLAASAASAILYSMMYTVVYITSHTHFEL